MVSVSTDSMTAKFFNSKADTLYSVQIQRNETVFMSDRSGFLNPYGMKTNSPSQKYLTLSLFLWNFVVWLLIVLVLLTVSIVLAVLIIRHRRSYFHTLVPSTADTDANTLMDTDAENTQLELGNINEEEAAPSA